jgi:hypothetical protein
MAVEQRATPVSDEQAGEVASQVFQHFKDTKGGVPNWARMMGNREEVLASFAKHMSMVMGAGACRAG